MLDRSMGEEGAPRGIYRADDRRGKKVGINGGRVQLRK